MALPISLKLQLGNLLESKACQLSHASSIILSLSGTSYWNFSLILTFSHLVEKFGDGQTKQLKHKYLEELKGF